MTEPNIAPLAHNFDPLSGSGGLPLTMSSREIAELTGKRHDHVIRDIEAMLKQISGDAPDLGDEQNQGVKRNKNNRGYTAEVLLPKNLTLNLVAGYRADIRLKIIDRWMELEARPTDPRVPTSFREALLLAAQQQEQIEAQQARIQSMEPKVEALDRISTADGSLNITQAAKALQMRPKDLFDWLHHNHWIYRRSGSDVWLGYQSRTTNGDLEHKVTTVLRADGSEKVTEQVRITAQGLTKLAKLVPSRAVQVEAV